MIRIYRRHLEKCDFTSEKERRCKCPIHAEGSIGDEKIRRSLNLTSWTAATRLVRDWEIAGTSESKAPPITLKEAHAIYLADLESRGISKSARRKCEILGTKLIEFTEDRNIRDLDSLGVAELTEFRTTWKGWGPLTHGKYIERLRAEFKFFLQRKWVLANPATFIKPPKTPKGTVVPFDDAELTKIHAASGKPRIRAFVLLLQYSGLRISDAVKLRVSDVRDGKLCITTKKTGSVVWLPLPPFVLSTLESLNATTYYFWTGESKLSTAVGSWRRSLEVVFTAAGVAGNPHKFRHTFATTLLSNGTSVEQVAKILGNSPKIVERHYDHWIKERMDQIELAVKKTWKAPPLVLVKK